MACSFGITEMPGDYDDDDDDDNDDDDAVRHRNMWEF
jgi:hypothetical protein